MKRLFNVTLAVLALVSALGLVSCKDADYVTPGQVDARVQSKWDDLTDALNNRIRSAENAIGSLDSTINSNKAAAEAARQDLNSLIQQVAVAAQTYTDEQIQQTREYAALQAQQANIAAIETMTTLLENARNELAAAIQVAEARIATIESVMNTQQAQINNNSAGIAQLNQKIVELIDVDMDLQTAIANAATRAEVALATAEDARNLAATALSFAIDALDQASNNKSNITELKYRVNILETEYVTKAELAETLGEINDLLEGLNGSTVAVKLDNILDSIAMQQAQLEAQEVRLTSLEQCCIQVQAELDNLKMENAQQNNAIEALQTIVTENRTTINALQNEVMALQAELEAARLEARAYTLEQCELVKAALTVHLDSLAGVTTDLRTIIDATVARIEDIYQRTCDRLDSLEHSINQQFLEHQTHLTYLDTLIQTLGEDFSNRMTNLEALMNTQIANIVNEMNRLEAEQARQTDRIDSLGVEHQALTDMVYDVFTYVQVLNERMNTMEDYFNDIKARIELLEVKVDELYYLFEYLNDRLNKLITGIVIQDKQMHCYYAQVEGTDTVFFPNRDFAGRVELEAETYNFDQDLSVGVIYATINSASEQDFSGTQFELENSLGTTSLYFKLGKAEKAENVRIVKHTPARYAPVNNHLYQFKVYHSFTKDVDPDTLTAETDLLLALVAPWTDSEGEHKVYSQYVLHLAPELVTAATAADLTFKGEGNNCFENPATGVDVRFSEVDGSFKGTLLLGRNGQHLYREFIECTQVRDESGEEIEHGADLINEANNMLKTIIQTAGNEEDGKVSITCPKALTGKFITLRYQALNYNGTIVTKDLVVCFSNETDIFGL
ncbi:MAG: hypothetical protein J5545_07620 [Bacteroidaceae bacterium]|nr:hypothetical protein [Bacteroidaceae bacterium]